MSLPYSRRLDRNALFFLHQWFEPEFRACSEQRFPGDGIAAAFTEKLKLVRSEIRMSDSQEKPSKRRRHFSEAPSSMRVALGFGQSAEQQPALAVGCASKQF